MDIILDINKSINDFVWGVPAMVLIIGVGLYLTIRFKFIQVRKFGLAIRETLGKLFKKKKDTGEGAVSPFQAVCTALASTVGTGNIAGVAGAIAIGGPGAVFWMWVSALLGMCTKFVEVVLALMYREKNKDGEWCGGPMYYIKNGLGKKWTWLGYVFAAFGVITVFGTGNATQVNTIVASINSSLYNFGLIAKPEGKGNVNLIIGIIIAFLVGMILLGGIKRLAAVTEKLVPIMALIFILLGLGVIAIRINRVPAVFTMIFEGAFAPRAVTGGIVGSIFIAMKRGVSRGIFSNEAGLGTASIAHASADNDNPVHQGLFGIFEVFMDTIVICTLTSLIILCSGVTINFGKDAGAELTISGLTETYGSWVSIIVAVALCCFAFSTILGWGLYGQRCAEFIFGTKIIRPFLVVYVFVSILGATMDLGTIWSIADTFNGLMAIPNLIALILLSPKAIKYVKSHEKYLCDTNVAKK